MTDVVGTWILYLQGDLGSIASGLCQTLRPIPLICKPIYWPLNIIEPIEPLTRRNGGGGSHRWSWPRTIGPPWFQLGAVSTQRKTPSRSPAAELERKELNITQSSNSLASGLPWQPLVQISLEIFLHHDIMPSRSSNIFKPLAKLWQQEWRKAAWSPCKLAQTNRYTCRNQDRDDWWC